jgi:tetratricopeptide (TPR) repeat protein
MINEGNLQAIDEQPLQTKGLARLSQPGYALIIIGVGILTYLNSFESGFVFDDRLYINPNLQNLWNATFGGDNMARPLIGFTLGLNYAISGFDDWSYHLLNLLIHILAALCLYGIVRRTLLTERLSDIFGKRAAPLALVIALLWMVHPLQTQAVTYIIQRCESLMGLFYLLTLYSAMRSFSSERKALWYVTAILACAAGMLSKQVILTAPLIVLLYDMFFVSSSFKGALQRHRGLYIGLASTWVLLVATFVAAPVNETAGFAVKGISPITYYLSQFRVIVQYVRLALYPDALSIDYGWKKATEISQVVPFAIPILILQAATLWGIYRRKPLAFLGAWFFGILAVTSSFMPFSDLVFEHRMYLPLAAVVTVIVLGADWLASRLSRQGRDYLQDAKSIERKLALAVVVVLVFTLGIFTVRRNMDYKTEFVLWADTVNKQPQSPRAHINHGRLLQRQGLIEEAAAHFAEALTYDPENLIGQNNYGAALLELRRAAEAKEHLLIAVALRPDFPLSHQNLGRTLIELGELDKAIEHLSIAIELDPKPPELHFYLGNAFQKIERYEEALASYDRTLQLDSTYVEALNEKALLYITAKDPKFRNAPEAIRCAELAVQLSNRRYGKAFDILAQSYAAAGRYPEAVEAATHAVNSVLARMNKEFAAASASRLTMYREKAAMNTAKTKSTHSASS